MIKCDIDDGVMTLTIARPDKANSLTGDMLSDLIAALDRVADAGIRAVILTGEGSVFSAGADLDQARAGLATSPLWDQLSGRISALPCLTIAALNGTLAGGAFGMVLACDLRVAVPGARFFYPVMRLGYLPQPADPGRLRDLVGPARAKMILMAGIKASADQALLWGLVDHIVSGDDLMATARDWAGDVRAADPAHVAAIKAMI
ncbi:enoyl-CoA hydratase/isomerase family protein [Paracoccus sp. (in: a-proteobacteria)]|uniref:enoyl-CoA hydratase/isomerase family protein n=1 Tax=Paracoccus sp. TaxID=267 RepID=UPI0026E08283|nr:enoyl-CoA hydratase/isomerase family protein [Paracoccus sp. (in: a-proteobacteria)]MDO5647027.1 enoyl-CoA hydratase/isomerase family protein [Paracoccus sp. (in: a-proteobacteria)]